MESRVEQSRVEQTREKQNRVKQNRSADWFTAEDSRVQYSSLKEGTTEQSGEE